MSRALIACLIIALCTPLARAQSGDLFPATRPAAPARAPALAAASSPSAASLPATAATAPGSALPPIPNKNECQSALNAIQAAHTAEYADHAPLAKQTLARKLLLEARGLPDANAKHYMLIREAARLAATIGDFDLVADALSDLRAAFAVDPEAIGLELCDTMAPVLTTPAQRRTLSLQYSDLIPRAWAREDFAAAAKYNTRALNMARVAGDAALAAAATRRASEINEAQQEFPPTLLARRKLLDTPDDPASCAIVGRFLCLFKGDFDAGLPLLAKGDRPDLKDLAARDLALKNAGPGDVLQLLAMAEAWRDLGDKSTGLVRKNALLRARADYDRFFTYEDTLRTRVHAIVQKIDEEFPPAPAATQPARP